jgi:uncharacterized Fe-S cluster-containing radical SAM superfamily protein
MNATNHSVIISSLEISAKGSTRDVLICLLIAKTSSHQCLKVLVRVSVRNQDQNLFTKLNHQNRTFWILKSVQHLIKLIVTKLQQDQKFQLPLNSQKINRNVRHPQQEFNLASRL